MGGVTSVCAVILAAGLKGIEGDYELPPGAEDDVWALTSAERRVLARKSLLTRIWMATGKKAYYAITRGLNVADREGRGVRFIREAPAIAERLRTHPRVRDVRPRAGGGGDRRRRDLDRRAHWPRPSCHDHRPGP